MQPTRAVRRPKRRATRTVHGWWRAAGGAHAGSGGGGGGSGGVEQMPVQCEGAPVAREALNAAQRARCALGCVLRRGVDAQLAMSQPHLLRVWARIDR